VTALRGNDPDDTLVAPMSAPPPSDASLTGTSLASRYELRAMLGRGGMGEVFEAVDRRLDRTVAVKVLRPELAPDARFLVRFRREARTSAALSHPGIVGVYDVGVDGVRAFIVMELVAGRTLHELAQAEGPLEPARVARLGVGIAQALAHAHARGVVHRDISPGNVMVTQDDRVKLLDFGIARAGLAAGSLDATAVASGTARGTIAYTAPEQLRGDTPDGRADTYSLGAVMAELLTGRPIPHRLERAIDRCLCADPGDRFANAADLAEELWRASLAAPEPTMGLASAVTAPLPAPATQPLPPIEPAPARSGRRRASRFVVGLSVAAALAGGALVVGPAIASLADDVHAHVKPPRRVAAPTGLTAAASCDGWFSTGVDLAWTSGGPSRGYEIWRQGGSEEHAHVIRRIDDPEVSTYRDIDLGVDTSYTYTVRAVDGVRVSRPSNEANADTPLLCLS
jgi:Protein kinase domain